MKSIEDLIKEIYLPDMILDDIRRPQKRSLQTRGVIAPETELTMEPFFPPIEKDNAWGMIIARVHAISHVVALTCMRNYEALDKATELIADWMKNNSIVRILGAGRALLAGSMPANRLAHGGAQVSFMGGMVPMPNSALGGGIISCSASGKTKAVIEAMEVAKQNNPAIIIIGMAQHDANEFQKLCDVYIGIHASSSKYENPLSALADTEEYVISEILDALIVMAGKKLGFTDEVWRKGHEDIGPTGPYGPKSNPS